ncbi:MAG TPA: hypothetical protein ENN67_08780, partial [Firmicutes bacterium]|nr:hypothetical protein [Bacillota bacterium]
MNSLFRSLTFKNIVKVAAGDITARAISVLTSIILIREMPVHDYAAFVVYLSVAVTLAGLVGNSINIALIRFAAEFISRESYRPVGLYRGVFIVEFAIAASLTLFAAIAPEKPTVLFFGQSDFVQAFMLGMLAGIASILLQLAQAFYQSEEKFNRYILTLWTRSLSVLAFTLILLGTKGITFMPVAIGFLVIDFALGAFFLIRHFAGITVVEGERAGAHKPDAEFFASSGWLIGYAVVLAAFGRVDIMMLSHFTSGEEVANYGVAFRYYSIMLISLGSITVVLRPKLAHADMLQPERQRAFLKNWHRYTLWTAIPILAFIIFGKPLYVWINGEQYSDSFSMFAILTSGVWLGLVLNPYVKILIANRNFSSIFFLGLAAFAVAITGNYFLVPVMGGIGAAIVTVAANTAINFPAMI